MPNPPQRICKTNEGAAAINLSVLLHYSSRSSIHAEGPLKITLPNVHGRAGAGGPLRPTEARRTKKTRDIVTYIHKGGDERTRTYMSLLAGKERKSLVPLPMFCIRSTPWPDMCGLHPPAFSMLNFDYISNQLDNIDCETNTKFSKLNYSACLLRTYFSNRNP